MKILTIISWRNIWRNPKRSIVMLLAIGIGLWGGIFAASFAFGLMEQRRKTSIEQHISHLQIHNPEFLNDDNIRNSIANFENLKQMLDSMPEVKAFTSRTQLSGMIAAANLTTGVKIIGVDPQLEGSTTNLESNTVEGIYFDDEWRNPILVGRTLAEKLKVQERSRIVLTFQDASNEIVSASFRVCGIFQTSNTTYDEMNVYVRQADLTNYLDSTLNITEIAIILNNFDDASGVAENIKSSFPELTVRTWAEVSPELSYLTEMASVMLTFILGIILMALAFGLVNTMLMSVHERIQELGMLMAIGMNKKKIFSMILLETSYLTFIGAAVGVVLGTTTVSLMGRIGINLGAVGGDSLNYMGFDSIVYPSLAPSLFATLTVLVVITAFIAAVFPALKALRLTPSEAVKME